MLSEDVITTDSAMELPRSEIPKLSDMVMCGDHSSVTRADARDREEREKAQVTYGKLSPTSSRTDKQAPGSEHALRALEARRQLKLEALRAPAVDVTTGGNRALVQAAMGSFRWPPYLLAVWVVVLLLTHSLHGLVAVLERALPAIKKVCHYFYAWTEESWKSDAESRRVLPAGLAAATGFLYALYSILYVVYTAALWAVEPLCEERTAMDDAQSEADLGGK